MVDSIAHKNPSHKVVPGKMYDPLDAEVKQTPYPYYEKMRLEQPIIWLEGMRAFAVAKYDDVDAMLKDADTYTSSLFWPELLGEFDPVPELAPMISMDPPSHTHLRKLATKGFTPSKVAMLEKRAVMIANELLDDIIAKHGNEGEFDWAWEFTALYPVTIISEFLGVPTERRAEFKVWVDDILSAANRLTFGSERLAHIAKSRDEVRTFFEELYDLRAANPGPDLISTLIQTEIGGVRMTRSEVLQMSVLLLIGGVETTTNLLGNVLVELNRCPDIYIRVRNDRALIPPLIEEVLRYNPPVQMIFRHTTKDTELGGVKIPKGSTMIPLLASANRDEAHFPDGERFNIDRTITSPLMSFGLGPHFCLGSYLSRMESKVALGVVFDRLEVLETVSDHVHWIDSYFARGPHTLPVRFKVR